MSWPPSLADLKDYVGVSDDRDDVTLMTALEAAIDYVTGPKGVLRGAYNFTGATTGDESLLPAPSMRVAQGTVRYASRLHNLRRSPDGTIDMGELGNARIPTNDPEIERLLGIGRWRGPMVGG
jgi:hypothetical protein